jgi:hypothetical protein
MTQSERLLVHLFENGHVNITHQPKLRITRLAAIVLQLKQKGVEIADETITVTTKYQTSHISNYYLV